MDKSKRVAIIGAGASGITAIKCCLDEGLEPVCYERTTNIGGLWYFTPEVKEEQACVMKTTVINTSKEMMAYSDFPIPGDFPNFMHNTKVVEYFKLYVEHFGLEKYIQFNTNVLKVRKTKDFSTTGKWEIDIQGKNDDQLQTQVFDAVYLCSGHHSEKNIPSFKGMDTFPGKVVHPHDYKDHKGYEDKRILVIGIGNSGGDVAVELSRIASQVYLSTRRGSWVTNRVFDNGLPVDISLTRRVVECLKSVLSDGMYNSVAEKLLNDRTSHLMYRLKPQHRYNEQHPMVNDDIFNRIICGSIVVKTDIACIRGKDVEFIDGTTTKDIDIIITATGYKFGFSYLDKEVIDVKDNVVELYKYVFPPDLSPGTLAVIGCVQPWGAIMPIAELQCRWAARVFKGVTSLPSRERMWADVHKKQNLMKTRYVSSPRHTIQVDWIPFMDELANEFGCKPNLVKLWLSDPKLAFQVLCGPCTPYQYRLHGPGSWSGARKAILTTWDRVYEPFKTRMSEQKTQANNATLKYIIVLVVAVAVLVTILLR